MCYKRRLRIEQAAMAAPRGGLQGSRANKLELASLGMPSVLHAASFGTIRVWVLGGQGETTPYRQSQ